MPYSFTNRGSVALVRWGEPVMSDVETCLDEVRRCRREVGPLVLVIFVPEGAPAPPRDVSAAMVVRFPELAAQTRLMFQVFEGSGFFVGFKRSVLTGMLLAASAVTPKARRMQLSVHGTFEEVAAHLSPADRRDLQELVAEPGRDADEISRTPLNCPSVRAVTGG
jgi:hypothetical protein